MALSRMFNGARLREAREARGLTGVTLAVMVEVTPSAISQYETGKKTPPPETIDRISGALNLPVAFFMRPSQPNISERLTFRSRSAATKALRQRETRRFHWFVEIVAFLKGLIDLPPVNFPQFELPDNAALLTEEEINRIAWDVRKFWDCGEGPIPDMAELLEANGAAVVRQELGSDYVDAYSDWQEGVPYIVLASDKLAAVRSRYDAAHELGHLILHRHIPPQSFSDSASLKNIEEQAHFFAGAFLLPAETFADDFIMPMLDSLLNLKPRWRVSVGAMIKRLAWLGLISPDQEHNLWIAWGRRGWRRREPYDEHLMIEQPHMLRAAFDAVLGSGKLTLGHLKMSLPYAISEVEQLTGLPHGYLSEMTYRSLRVRDDESGESSSRLIHFPN